MTDMQPQSPIKSGSLLYAGHSLHVMILANPTSGGYRPKELDKLKDQLEKAGCDVTLRLTAYAGEIGEIASDPGLAVSVLAVAGGDGSINEAVTGLRDHPCPPALAVIPCGTANVLAQELQLPSKPDAIARAILAGKATSLHYGLANGHPFVLMASSGFDAEVVHSVPLDLKRRLGKLAYVITAIRIALSRKRSSLVVDFDGQSVTGKLVVATNGRCYGGPFVIHPQASVSKAGLHLLILEKDDFLSTIRFGLALVLGRIHHAKGVITACFETARISAAKSAVAAQIDGDPFGVTPVELTASSDSLELIVP